MADKWYVREAGSGALMAGGGDIIDPDGNNVGRHKRYTYSFGSVPDDLMDSYVPTDPEQGWGFTCVDDTTAQGTVLAGSSDVREATAGEVADFEALFDLSTRDYANTYSDIWMKNLYNARFNENPPSGTDWR